MSKLDNKKFMVCSANGAGSSLMMKMTLQKVLTKHKIKPAGLHHCALSEGKSLAPQYDIVLCAKNFVSTFKDAEKKGLSFWDFAISCLLVKWKKPWKPEDCSTRNSRFRRRIEIKIR